MSSPFGPPVAQIPVAQLNALPLLTAQQFVDGNGVNVQVNGQSVSKFWSPAVLGINGSAPVAAINTKWCLLTPWLDVSPCKLFLAVVLRNVGTLTTAPPSMWIQMQFRLTAADTPSPAYTVGASLQDQLNACYNVNSTALGWGAAQAAGDVQRAALAWGLSTPSAQPLSNVPNMIGANVRLMLNWQTNAPNSGGRTDTFSLSLWGTS